MGGGGGGGDVAVGHIPSILSDPLPITPLHTWMYDQKANNVIPLLIGTSLNLQMYMKK